MSKELVNVDKSILKMTKAGLEKSALNLQSSYDPLTEYEIWYKISHFVKYRMECIKENALDTFKEKFEGSAYEKENGFQISLKQNYEYDYGDYVESMEKKIKQLQEDVKKEKERIRESARGSVKSETLALTLK